MKKINEAITGWDIQGLALRDYYQGDLRAELLVESNCAWPERMPVSIFFRNYSQLPELERYALSLCKGTVLDIGAGAGSHSLILQEKGFIVYAVDISPYSAEVMRERGLKNVYCMEIKVFNAPPFDTIIILMNGIGLAGDLSGLDFFLKNIKRLLKPDGQLLFDSTDLNYLRKEPDTAVNQVLKTGKNYGKVIYQYEYKGIRGFPFNWLYVDQITLRKYCRRNGWDCQVIYEEDFQYLARLTLL